MIHAPLDNLMTILDEHGLDIHVLRDAASGCPMCMLAAVMAMNRENGWKRKSEEYWDFDYRAEMIRFDKFHQNNEIEEVNF